MWRSALKINHMVVRILNQLIFSITSMLELSVLAPLPKSSTLFLTLATATSGYRLLNIPIVLDTTFLKRMNLIRSNQLEATGHYYMLTDRTSLVEQLLTLSASVTLFMKVRSLAWPTMSLVNCGRQVFGRNFWVSLS